MLMGAASSSSSSSGQRSEAPTGRRDEKLFFTRMEKKYSFRS
jgi:hypothetical protein